MRFLSRDRNIRNDVSHDLSAHEQPEGLSALGEGELKSSSGGNSQSADEGKIDDNSAEAGTSGSNAGGVARLKSRLRLVGMPRTRLGRVLSGVLVLTLIAGAGVAAWWKFSGLPENAAFSVGDRVVSVDELNEEISKLRALYGVQTPQEQSRKDRFRRDAAKSFAVALVMDKSASDEGVTVADKKARDALSRFISKQYGSGPNARQQFIASLGEAGASEVAVFREVKRQLTMSQLFEKVTRGVEVSDREIIDTFNARKREYATPEKRAIRNIVVGDRATADAVAVKARAGEEFNSLVKRYSLDSATRDSNGQLGKVSAEELQEGYAKVAFAADRREVFGPVKTADGWNVGIVDDVVAPIPADLTKYRSTVRQQLVLEKSMKEWRHWIQKEMAEADIEYSDTYRPQNPDAPPLLPPRSTKSGGGGK